MEIPFLRRWHWLKLRGYVCKQWGQMAGRQLVRTAGPRHPWWLGLVAFLTATLLPGLPGLTFHIELLHFTLHVVCSLSLNTRSLRSSEARPNLGRPSAGNTASTRSLPPRPHKLPTKCHPVMTLMPPPTINHTFIQKYSGNVFANRSFLDLLQSWKFCNDSVVGFLRSPVLFPRHLTLLRNSKVRLEVLSSSLNNTSFHPSLLKL